MIGGMLGDCGGAPGVDHSVVREPGVCFAACGDSGIGPESVFADRDLVIAVSEMLHTPAGRDLAAQDVADLYRRYGTDFLRRVSGTFSIALMDRRERKLILAVDRAGIRPLYLWQRDGVVAFASRLAALRRMPGFQPVIDRQALFDYLYFHVVPSPGTIYQGCEKLLPAQVLTLGDPGRSASFYWSMPYRDDNPATFDELREQLLSLLPRVVDRAAGDAENVGTFLSGGTDSSTVAGTLRRSRGRAVRTYSVGFQAEGFDEMAYARIAARHFATDAREYYVTPEDVVESIPGVAAYCDEPFGNASVVPAYLCARFAREQGTDRLLAGDGGDEIFGGNARYANQRVFELYGRLPAWLRRGLFEPFAFGIPLGDRIPPLRKVRSYISQARVPLPDRLETYNFLHRTPLEEIFDPDFLAAVDPQHPIEDLRDVYDRAHSSSSINRMMHLDLKITLADNDLRKVNQGCGLAGVDVRYPLLDDEMLELAAAVPPDLHVKTTELRWFFKRALADFLPAEIINKKKHGFGLPVGLWMAEFRPLEELTRESLAALRGRGILNPAYLDWVSEQHRNAHASYYGVMLWVAVMLEQWLQRHGH